MSPVEQRFGVGSPLVSAGDGSVPPEPADLWLRLEGAACRGAGTAEFFGAAAARGRRRCAACPVSEVCFWWAIVAEADLGWRFGIWGGATPAVRAQVAQVTGVAYARARFEAEALFDSAKCGEAG